MLKKKRFVGLCNDSNLLVSPGLSKLPSEDAKQLALDLAQRWIRTNWLAYGKYEAMFEKVSLLKSRRFPPGVAQ